MVEHTPSKFLQVFKIICTPTPPIDKRYFLKISREGRVGVMDDRKTREERYKKRTRQRNKIEKDLLNQLGDNKNNSHYTELIKDYLFMWDTMQELKLDIKERGVSVFWQNSETQFGYKKNDSIREMTTVSNQMLKILNDLGLKPSKAEEVDEDDEIFL